MSELQTNCGSVKNWAPHEDAILRRFYRRPNIKVREIAALLPGRNKAMVLGRARRLGLAKELAARNGSWSGNGQYERERPKPSLPKLRFMGEV